MIINQRITSKAEPVGYVSFHYLLHGTTWSLDCWTDVFSDHLSSSKESNFFHGLPSTMRTKPDDSPKINICIDIYYNVYCDLVIKNGRRRNFSCFDHQY